MKGRFRDIGMIAGMVIAWTAYYAVSKYMVGVTGSPYATGFLLRMAALVFLSAQLALTGGFRELFRQGKTTVILVIIGVFGFLLDLFANLGYAAGGSLGTGTALLKTDVLMVNLLTVAICHKRLYATDWIGSLLMLFGVLLVLGQVQAVVRHRQRVRVDSDIRRESGARQHTERRRVGQEHLQHPRQRRVERGEEGDREDCRRCRNVLGEQAARLLRVSEPGARRRGRQGLVEVGDQLGCHKRLEVG